MCFTVPVALGRNSQPELLSTHSLNFHLISYLRVTKRERRGLERMLKVVDVTVQTIKKRDQNSRLERDRIWRKCVGERDGRKSSETTSVCRCVCVCVCARVRKHLPLLYTNILYLHKHTRLQTQIYLGGSSRA